MEQVLEKLFGSVPKIKLLKLFLMNPEQEFTLAEITKHAQLKSSAVKKELTKLVKLSLVKSKILTIPEAKKTRKKPKRKVNRKKTLVKKASTKTKKSAKIFKTRTKAKKRK